MSLAPSGLVSRSAIRSSRAAARPQLQVLGRPRHPRRYVLAGLLIAASGIFGIVSLNALAAEAAFEARALEREVTELSLRYDELTAEVAALSAPSRVRQVAQEELGMVPASEPGFLLTDAGTSAGGDSPPDEDGSAARDVAMDPAGLDPPAVPGGSPDGRGDGDLELAELSLGGLRAGVHALNGSSGAAPSSDHAVRQASGARPAAVAGTW